MAAANAAVTYGPDVLKKATELVKRATNGAVSQITPAQLQSYVQKEPARMSVVASALAQVGIGPDYITDEMTRQSSSLAQIRQSAQALVANVVNEHRAGSAKAGLITSDEAARARYLKFQIETVLSIYGTKTRYLACHPNSGIAAEQFDAYETLTGRRVN